MRTVLLANNHLGAAVGRYLADREELIGLILHPPARRAAAAELEALEVPAWSWPDGRDAVAALEPECLLSVLFGLRVPPEWLDLASWRALNLHPGLLPFNRGANPNVWPLIDGSPAGTTLHVMSAQIDAGEIVAQRRVETYPSDTGFTLYQRLQAASLDLLVEVWPDVTSVTTRAQVGPGTEHRVRDLDVLDLDDQDFPTLDKLRARHFPPYGAQFERGGIRYQVQVTIERVPDAPG